MKRGTPELLKFSDLEDLLKVPRYAAVGVLECLWHLTAKNAPDGAIGRWSPAVIAKNLGWKGSPDKLIEALITSRWLDRHPTHRLVVHDWPKHCEDAVHRDLARQGRYFADGSRPNLQRLSGNERKAAERKYEENAHLQPAPAETPPKETSSSGDNIDVGGIQETSLDSPGGIQEESAFRAPCLSHAMPSQALAKPLPPIAPQEGGSQPEVPDPVEEEKPEEPEPPRVELVDETLAAANRLIDRLSIRGIGHWRELTPSRRAKLERRMLAEKFKGTAAEFLDGPATEVLFPIDARRFDGWTEISLEVLIRVPGKGSDKPDHFQLAKEGHYRPGNRAGPVRGSATQENSDRLKNYFRNRLGGSNGTQGLRPDHGVGNAQLPAG